VAAAPPALPVTHVEAVVQPPAEAEPVRPSPAENLAGLTPLVSPPDGDAAVLATVAAAPEAAAPEAARAEPAQYATTPAVSCPTCGAPVPAEDLFCGDCGSPMATATPAAPAAPVAAPVFAASPVYAPATRPAAGPTLAEYLSFRASFTQTSAIAVFWIAEGANLLYWILHWSNHRYDVGGPFFWSAVGFVLFTVLIRVLVEAAVGAARVREDLASQRRDLS